MSSKVGVLVRRVIEGYFIFNICILCFKKVLFLKIKDVKDVEEGYFERFGV